MTTGFSEADARGILKEVVPTVDWTAVVSDASMSDAGLDSLDKANLFLRLEEVANVQIPDAEYEDIDTIDAIVTAVASKQS